ncbi:MAG TPA: efflux RND transporter permease subunit, partial [Tabrizicola sp.]|nr:efflux RND transporter permease subunit [Tabrizicola sp.]
TVVVALLPMLFVSGLMGPYMSPIPANASAAMIFSFFVAVIITPWLMVKIASRADTHDQAGDAEFGGLHGGWLEKAYVAAARPILKTRARSLGFLLLTAALSFGSLAALFTRDVTVKLLPFDNKSELSVVIDLPEGSSIEATDRVARDVAEVVMGLPEVTSVQTYAGTPAPFNFNGLVRHYYLRSEPQQGEVAIKLAPKTDRDRASHDIALDLRERLKAGAVPAGTSLKVGDPPPGPPVISTLLAEVYGPDAETRRAAATLIRQAFEAVPFIVDVDDSFGEQARRLRATISSDDLDFYAVQEQDVFDTLALLNGGQTVGYSHRGEGRLPIPLVVGRDKSDRVMDERFLTTPIPANALPGARGVVELGDVIRVEEEAASFPIFRHNGRNAEMVTAELAGDFEAPLYG